MDPSDTVAVEGGKFTVNIENGQPKVYYPIGLKEEDSGMSAIIIIPSFCSSHIICDLLWEKVQFRAKIQNGVIYSAALLSACCIR